MSRKAENLVGRKFGRWTVIARAENVGTRAAWLCKCDCGAEHIVRADCLRRGKSLSCGCLAIERSIEAHKYTNTYIFKSDYVEVYTVQGQRILIDVDDFDVIRQYYWFVDDSGYARSCVYKNHVAQRIRMHQLIMHCPDGMEVDHIHGDTLDNRKSQLRICTHQQNSMNASLRIDNSVGVKGVSIKHNKNGTVKYCAYITKNYKRHHLGEFDTLDDAKKARQDAEIRLYGEYSRNYGGNNL